MTSVQAGFTSPDEALNCKGGCRGQAVSGRGRDRKFRVAMCLWRDVASRLTSARRYGNREAAKSQRFRAGWDSPGKDKR